MAAAEAAVCPSESGGGTVIIGTTDAIASLDPADAYSTRDSGNPSQLRRATVEVGPRSGDELVAGIAEGMPTPSEDGLSWTITLREGLTFGDGTPLTADIAAAELTRLLTISETYGTRSG